MPYRILAGITHAGRNTKCGHYRAFLSDAPLSTNTWFTDDDQPEKAAQMTFCTTFTMNATCVSLHACEVIMQTMPAYVVEGTPTTAGTYIYFRYNMSSRSTPDLLFHTTSLNNVEAVQL